MAELKTVQIGADLYAQLADRKKKTGVPIARSVEQAIRFSLDANLCKRCIADWEKSKRNAA